jgi:hypothetical protein
MLSKAEKLARRNRANAKKSTGPKTEAGKARSAMNATKHGLAGQTVVLPGEDLAAFESLRKRFFAELRPKGILEEQCVETITNKTWLLARADALQNNIFAQGKMKHAHRIETGDPRVHAALTAVHTFTEHINNLDKLSRYEARHHKMYREALASLKELQTERKEVERQTMRIAARAGESAGTDAVHNELEPNDFPSSGSESRPSHKLAGPASDLAPASPPSSDPLRLQPTGS